MAKSDAKKRAEMMAKEWKKSRCTPKSLNDLIEIGLLHNQELGGWRALAGESYPDPRASEIVVFEDFLRGVLGCRCIHFFRACFCTTRLGFAICTQTQFFWWQLSFIFAKLLWGLNHTSIYSVTCSV